MPTMIATAAAVWGLVCQLPVFAVIDTNIDYAAANRYTDRCQIAYNPEWFKTLTPDQKQNVVTHEYGHCIGVNHLPAGRNGVMNGQSGGNDWSGWDRWQFWHDVKPAPYRALTIAVSRE